MHDGQVESTRYPRNPLDVLAQQIVAMAGLETWEVDHLFAAVRRAAPLRSEPSHLRRRPRHAVGEISVRRIRRAAPRVTWDRVNGTISGREGATRVAIAGTIPTAGCRRLSRRRRSTGSRRRARRRDGVRDAGWRDFHARRLHLADRDRRDRVLVTPAPGEPGKMPFWHGDRAGRPVELGYTIGRLVRELHGAAGRGARAALRLTSTISSRLVPSRTTAPSSSNDASMISGTGGCASSRRSAAAFTHRGPWP